MNTEEVKPTYEFVVPKEGETIVSPIRRNIAKTMPVTENFTIYDTMVYMAKMEKAIQDKYAEIEGLKNMKEAYAKELALVQDSLDIEDLEAQFAAEMTAQIAEEVKKAEEAKAAETAPTTEAAQ